MKPEFSEFDAQVIGISVDGVWCHLAFSKDRELHIPLLADFEPKGAVARQYGVYREVWEDADGKVWIFYNSPGYLQERYRIPSELLQNIAVAEGLAAKASD